MKQYSLQDSLQDLGAKILWWHDIYKREFFVLPCKQLLRMLENLLRKGLESDKPTDLFFGKHSSLFHYAAAMNWHNVCYLFVDYGADPFLKIREKTAMDLLGKGLWIQGRWESFPLSEEEREHYCNEMQHRRTVYLDQKRRDSNWQRRRHMILMLSGSGFLDDHVLPPLLDTWQPLPPISRMTSRDNMDYLIGSIFANQPLRECIVSFL